MYYWISNIRNGSNKNTITRVVEDGKVDDDNFVVDGAKVVDGPSPSFLMVPKLSIKPWFVIITSMSLVSITPEFIVQV